MPRCRSAYYYFIGCEARVVVMPKNILCVQHRSSSWIDLPYFTTYRFKTILVGSGVEVDYHLHWISPFGRIYHREWFNQAWICYLRWICHFIWIYHLGYVYHLDFNRHFGSICLFSSAILDEINLLIDPIFDQQAVVDEFFYWDDVKFRFIINY